MSSETTPLLRPDTPNQHGAAQHPIPPSFSKPTTSNNTSPNPQSHSQQDIYRSLIGINPTVILETQQTPPLLTRLRRYIDSSTPHHTGYYASILEEQGRATRLYYASALLVDASLFLHVLIAATITTLSASSSASTSKKFQTPITVLAAVNTVIGAVCAYVKGRGLPTRMGEYQGELQLLRDHAEFVDRLYGQGLVPSPPEPLDQARLVQKMYEAVRKDEIANQPDTYSKGNVTDALAGGGQAREMGDEQGSAQGGGQGAGGQMTASSPERHV